MTYNEFIVALKEGDRSLEIINYFINIFDDISFGEQKYINYILTGKQGIYGKPSLDDNGEIYYGQRPLSIHDYKPHELNINKVRW